MHSDSTNRWYSSALLAVFTALLFVVPGTSQAQVNTAMSADLQAAKAALAKYADPIVAVRDGYFSTVACVDFPQGATDGPMVYPPGAMGVHFLNPANIGPKLEPTKPQILIYEQVGDKLVLTAAEWFVPVEIAGGVAPSIFGQTLMGPMNGHEPIIPATLKHYDLHVWLWKDNPKGMFTSTNAAVKCAAGAPYTVVPPHQH
jgi:hypothetical protein